MVEWLHKKMITSINIKLFKIIVPIELFKKNKYSYVVTGILCTLSAVLGVYNQTNISSHYLLDIEIIQPR